VEFKPQGIFTGLFLFFGYFLTGLDDHERFRF